MNKMHKQMQRAKKSGLTSADLLRMKMIAEKKSKEMEQEATERAFLYMLAIPLNVLVNDYWSKTAKKKAPKFIEDVMSLYDSVAEGVVTEKELAKLLYDYSGVKISADWLKGEKDESKTLPE